jgi:hypothetical protein
MGVASCLQRAENPCAFGSLDGKRSSKPVHGRLAIDNAFTLRICPVEPCRRSSRKNRSCHTITLPVCQLPMMTAFLVQPIKYIKAALFFNKAPPGWSRVEGHIVNTKGGVRM